MLAVRGCMLLHNDAVEAIRGVRAASYSNIIRPAQIHGHRVRRAAGNSKCPGRGDADDTRGASIARDVDTVAV